MILRLVALALTLLASSPVRAATLEEVERLWAARSMPLEIERMGEALDVYLLDLDDAMLAGQGGEGWLARGRVIFDRDRIAVSLKHAFAEHLSSTETLDLAEIGESELGTRWSRAFLDAQADLTPTQAMDDAIAALAVASGSRMERIRMMREDLLADAYVDQMMAANLNYYRAFLQAALAGGAFGPPPGDAVLDQMVQSAAAEYRQRGVAEILAISVRAAETFSDAELAELSNMKNGTTVDTAYAALFDAYEQVFTPLYRELGAEVSRIALEEAL